MKKGYSIIEILVVVGVFAVLAVLATQSINLSLKSAKKSDSIVLVKQELENVAGTIERQLQSASSLIVGVDCVIDTATPSVGLRNSAGVRSDYACFDSPPSNFYGTNDPRIVYSTGETINYTNRLTSSGINITFCQFSCYKQGTDMYIDFNVTANVKGVAGAEGAAVTTSRKVMIRGGIKR